MIASLAWGAVSPILAANQVISVESELALHWLNFGVVVSAACILCFCYWNYTPQPRPRNADVAVFVGVIVSLCSSVILWWNSDRLFYSWKVRSTPAVAWQQVAEQVNAFATQVVATNDSNFWISIQKANLSQAFDRIGRKSEFAFGRAQMDPSSKIQAEVMVAYGYKSRRWGLWQGDDVKNITRRWPAARIVPVSENLFFFVTPDF